MFTQEVKEHLKKILNEIMEKVDHRDYRSIKRYAQFLGNWQLKIGNSKHRKQFAKLTDYVMLLIGQRVTWDEERHFTNNDQVIEHYNYYCKKMCEQIINHLDYI